MFSFRRSVSIMAFAAAVFALPCFAANNRAIDFAYTNLVLLTVGQDNRTGAVSGLTRLRDLIDSPNAVDLDRSFPLSEASTTLYGFNPINVPGSELGTNTRYLESLVTRYPNDTEIRVLVTQVLARLNQQAPWTELAHQTFSTKVIQNLQRLLPTNGNLSTADRDRLVALLTDVQRMCIWISPAQRTTLSGINEPNPAVRQALTTLIALVPAQQAGNAGTPHARQSQTAQAKGSKVGDTHEVAAE